MKLKLFSKQELKTLWPFYLNGLFMILLIHIPFYVLYFNSIGFSASQIGILMAVWPLASLLFEVPTGAIADLYGRKFSVRLGVFLMGILLISFFFFTNYYLIMLTFILLGISQTFVSGSFEAWVVDLLKAKKMKKFLHSFFSKRHSISNLGIVLSGFVGAFLVSKFGLRIIWIASGTSFLLSWFFFSFAEEIYKKNGPHIKISLKIIWKQSKDSIKYGYKHHVLFYLFIIAFVFSISLALRGFISWTPLLKSFNFPDYSFGYLWSALGVVGVFAPLLANKFLKKNKEKNLLIITSFLLFIYGFMVLLSNNLYLLILVFLFGGFILNFRVPIRLTYFHRFIPTKIRSTIGSVRGMLISISSIIGLSLSGILVDRIGGRYTIFVSSLLMIPIIILYLMIKE